MLVDKASRAFSKSAAQKESFQEIKAYSAGNLERMRKVVGPEAASYARRWAEGQSLSVGAFHETDQENLPCIAVEGRILSLDSLRARKQEFKSGMSYEDEKLDNIFNNVSHQKDEFQDYVYARPHVGGRQSNPHRSTGNGIYVPSMDEDGLKSCWFSFRDGNQLSESDYEAISLGMSVTLGFNKNDAYEAKDITEAIALKAVQRLTNISYIAAIKSYVYEKQLEAYEQEPGQYLPPDAEDNKSFEAYFEEVKDYGADYLDNGMLEYTKSLRIRSCLKDTALSPVEGIPHLDDDVIKSESFKHIYEETCSMICNELAFEGQIAISDELALDEAAIICEKGQEQDLKSYLKSNSSLNSPEKVAPHLEKKTP